MTSLRKLFLLLVVGVSVAATVSGQTYSSPSTSMSAATDVGIRPLVPYEGTKENVNVTNGNVNLTIPLLVLPGRNKHDLALNLIYDSKIWKFTAGYDPESNTMGGYWEIDSREPNLGPGWHLNIPTLYTTESYDWNTGACMRTYVVTTFSGGKISFKYNCATQNPPQVVDSDDEVGMRFDFTQGMLLTPDGMRWYFNSEGPAYKIVDSNGNVISITTNGPSNIATIKDTLGREVSVDFSGVTYKRSGTTTATISFQYAPISVHYCSAPS